MSTVDDNFVMVGRPVPKSQSDLIRDLQKKNRTEKLKCRTKYLDMYMKQVIQNNSQTDLPLNVLFPFPMFEYMATCTTYGMARDQIEMLELGMSTNFHVLYAESEILKILVND